MFVSKIVSNTRQERKEASSIKEPELMLIRKFGMYVEPCLEHLSGITWIFLNSTYGF